LRRLLYCGEWIQSHALHIHLLAAPDFLGFESALAMAKTFPHVVKRGLALILFAGGLDTHFASIRPVLARGAGIESSSASSAGVTSVPSSIAGVGRTATAEPAVQAATAGIQRRRSSTTRRRTRSWRRSLNQPNRN
jgi:hypothetical protein